MQKKIYILSALLFVAFTRIIYLGLRPFHHDESIHGWFSLGISNGVKYFYDPTYHGPLLLHIGAVIIKVFGPSDVLLRMYPVLCGILLVFVPLFFVRWLDFKVVVAAAFFVLISPSILYYSRFYRSDIPVLLFMTLSIYWLIRYIDKEKLLYLCYSGLFCGLSFSSKENTYVYGFFFVMYLTYLVVTHPLGLKKILRPMPWLIWVATFAFIVLVLYSSVFRNVASLLNLPKALTYWFGQHKEARIGGPWWFYLLRIIVYEPYTLCAIPASFYYLYKHSKQIKGFFAFWFLTHILIYSYLQEKVPWLIVHLLFPGIVVTAFFIVDVYNKGKNWLKIVTYAFIILTTLYTLISSVKVNYVDFDNAAQPMTYMEVPRNVKEIISAVGKNSVFLQNKVSWPLSWYFSAHGVPANYSDNLNDAKNHPFIIVDKADFQTMKLPSGYISKVYVIRNWWVMDINALTFKKFVRLILYREPFSPLGEYYITFAWKPDAIKKNPEPLPSTIPASFAVLKALIYLLTLYLLHIPIICRLKGEYPVLAHLWLPFITLPILFYTGVYLHLWQASASNARIYFILLLIPLILFIIKDKLSHKWIYSNKKELLTSMGILFGGFALFSLIGAKLPFVTDTEKPFDFAFLKSAVYSLEYPFKDPWFAGETVKYYTLGYLIFGWIGKLMSIAPQYLYNIAKILTFTYIFALIFAFIKNARYPLVFLILSALSLSVGGNLEGIIQVYKNSGFDAFNFWASSRIINGTINEFPFFSFIIGDLHAHFVSLPFIVTLLLYIKGYTKQNISDGLLIATLCLITVIMNPWNAFALGLLFAVVFILLPKKKEWIYVGIASFVIYLVWFNIFLQHPETDFKLKLVEKTMLSTPRELILEFGIFFLALLPLFETIALLIIGSIFLLVLFFNKYAIIFLLALAIYSTYKTLKQKDFHWALILTAFFIIILCEIVYIDDAYGPPYERMNTVFKFHYIAWIFFLCGIFPVLLNAFEKPLQGKIVMVTLSALLIVYPIGTLLNHVLKSNYFTLNAFTPFNQINPDDLLAIEWVNQNLPQGSTVVERYGNGYDYGGRFGSYSQFSTVLGWINHENLWRKTYDKINERKMDIDSIYTTNNTAIIIKKYAIDFIVFGQYEAKFYKTDNLAGSYVPVYSDKTIKIYKTENNTNATK